MTLLVLGGAGYIGSVLCEMAQHDHHIIVIDKGASGCRSLLGLDIDFLPLDIVREKDRLILRDVCKKADVIVNLAALVGVPACIKDPALSYLSNVVVAQNIRECARRIIFASTTSVYGKVEGICTEQTALNPLSQYAIDKLHAEQLLKDRGVVFRFSTAFGVSRNLRLNLLPNELVYRALRDKALLLYEGHAKRQFVHVRDMARLLLSAATTSTFKDEIYNVGSVECTKKELAEEVKRLTNCDVIYQDYMQDPERRDMTMDFSKLNTVYKKSFLTLNEGLQQLVNQMPMILCEETFL